MSFRQSCTASLNTENPSLEILLLHFPILFMELFN